MNIRIETHGAGPALLLLHGWGLNGAIWKDVARPLMESFTLHIADYSADYGDSMDGLADALAAQLPQQFHALGWSLGGQLALNMALRQPDRLQSLILVATTPRFIQATDWPHAMALHTLDEFATRLQTHYRATLRSFLALQALNLPHAKSVVAALQNAMSWRGEPSATALAAGLQLLKSNDLREEVKKIAQPALVLQGDRDMLTPEPAARWLAEAMPFHEKSRYEKIAGCAHAPFLSHQTQFINHLREFLL